MRKGKKRMFDDLLGNEEKKKFKDTKIEKIVRSLNVHRANWKFIVDLLTKDDDELKKYGKEIIKNKEDFIQMIQEGMDEVDNIIKEIKEMK
jgi:hypothetical protein